MDFRSAHIMGKGKLLLICSGILLYLNFCKVESGITRAEKKQISNY